MQPLQANQKVTAIQVACEDDPAKTITSPESDPVTVQPAPNPMPAPSVYAANLIAGNDTVDLTGLYVGARVRVYDNGTEVGGGYATGSGNYVPIDPPLTSSSSITATQELCGNTSPESDPEKPGTELSAPTLLGPICKGQRHVLVRDTILNATVVVFRNGSIVGYGGAGPGDVVLGLGDNYSFNTGDQVTVRQYMGTTTVSPVSNTVTVVNGLGAPSVEITGGEPFFPVSYTHLTLPTIYSV